MAFPTGWQRRAQITVADAMSGGLLSDFPVLLTAAVLPAEFCSDSDANRPQSDGGDIRAATNSDGSGQLPIEIVHYNQNATSNGKIEIWVKVPSIAAAADTTFWLFWKGGGSEVADGVTDTYGRNAVWSGYEAVWHGNATVDSTGNGFTLTEAGTVGTGSGTSPWGGDTWDFDGSTANYMRNASAPVTAEPIMMTCFFKADAVTADTTLVNLGDGATTRGFHRLAARGDELSDLVKAQSVGDTTGGSQAASASGYNTTDWFHGAAAFTTSASRYAARNGVYGSQDTGSITVTPELTSIGVLARGTGFSSLFGAFDGQITEARIGATILTTEWLAAEYNNGSAIATYISDGAPEATGFGGGTTILRHMMQYLH